jgi:hypothetical protein
MSCSTPRGKLKRCGSAEPYDDVRRYALWFPGEHAAQLRETRMHDDSRLSASAGIHVPVVGRRH